MSVQLPLAEERKVTVTFRLEPGCLGPQGKSHIDDFCDYAQKEFEATDAGFAHWDLSPRHDKTLPEMEYSWHGRNITRHQAERYFHALSTELEDFEVEVHEKLVHLIEVYFERH